MSASGARSATLSYDPLGRLIEKGAATKPRFNYDGQMLISGHDNSNVLQRRYVHGPGADEPLLWYEGAGTVTTSTPPQKSKPGIVCPRLLSLGLGAEEVNRRTNTSAGRAALRSRDIFSIPSIDNCIDLFMKSLPSARNNTKSYIRGQAEYGNFLFGAETAAGGLPLQEALNWGANAQIVQDLMKLQILIGSDNPNDADTVMQGYNYYQSGCKKQ